MFNSILADVESVFASSAWLGLNVKAIPSNYSGKLGNGVTEYVIVNVLPTKKDYKDYEKTKVVSGLLAVKMFVPYGNGQARVMGLADVLDNLLEDKVLPNNTKLEASYLSMEGKDPYSAAFYTASYFIPFKNYGD